MKRLLTLILLVTVTSLGLAGPIRNIPQSSPLRKQLLDMFRPSLEHRVNQRVKFKVEKCVTQDQFAYVAFQPLRADGGQINWKRTQYREAFEQGAFEPGGGALFKKVGGRWKLLTWAFGATDVFWDPWPAQYGASRALFMPN